MARRKVMSSMKAVVYRGPENMVVESVDQPRIMAPTDAIVKITDSP